MNTIADGETIVRAAFARARVPVSSLEMRQSPEETIFVAYVDPEDFRIAADVGNSADAELAAAGIIGFVAVRRATTRARRRRVAMKAGVADARATEFTQLIAARSRTSLAQPSLSYVADIRSSLAAATAARHHLIFGRRGAGKTALMVEAKRVLEARGDSAVWMNLQSYRGMAASRVFIYYAREVVESVAGSTATGSGYEGLADATRRLLSQVEEMIDKPDDPQLAEVQQLIPEVQRLLARFLSTSGTSLYVFLDDFYFVPRAQQPQLLDLIHATLRDTDAWLKVATIKHLTRWFMGTPPLGLQTGHDADLLDIDVSLQDARGAKDFLEDVLERYAHEAGIGAISSVLSPGARDRLVLASGAVPRDYLVLCGGSVRRAQRRPRARLVGTQDVNQEAGERAKDKVHELEEDLANDAGTSGNALRALSILKSFCLDEMHSTYFRVDLREKERRPEEYNALVSLMDLRLAHLLDSAVSSAHVAGEMSEVFMLDLSQFSGSRLKQNLRVLDLVRGVVVAKQTGGGEAPQPGRTPRALTTIYRSGPLLRLDRLTPAAIPL